MLSRNFGTVETLEKHGLLAWVEKDKRLFIALPLASVMIARGMDGFQNFLDNVTMYHAQKELERQYRAIVRDRQREAVKKRTASGVRVKAGELDSIRRAVVDALQPDDIAGTTLAPFDFFIISDSVEGYSQAEVSFVGHYNPDSGQVDMAPWSDIQQLINSSTD